jgi:predicted ribosome quality control (RQC) complex YloA/Tae2 family protein
MKTHTIIDDITGIEYQVYVGRNAKDNTTLVLSSDPWDIWFHLGDEVSSPHIILKLPNRDSSVSRRVLYQVGKLFEVYKPKIPKKYKVIYTNISNVYPTKTLGMVETTDTNHFTLYKSVK